LQHSLGSTLLYFYFYKPFYTSIKVAPVHEGAACTRSPTWKMCEARTYTHTHTQTDRHTHTHTQSGLFVKLFGKLRVPEAEAVALACVYCVCVCTHTHTHSRTHAHTHTHTHTHQVGGGGYPKACWGVGGEAVGGEAAHNDSVKRDLQQCEKRPATVSKETWCWCC